MTKFSCGKFLSSSLACVHRAYRGLQPGCLIHQADYRTYWTTGESGFNSNKGNDISVSHRFWIGLGSTILPGFERFCQWYKLAREGAGCIWSLCVYLVPGLRLYETVPLPPVYAFIVCWCLFEHRARLRRMHCFISRNVYPCLRVHHRPCHNQPAGRPLLSRGPGSS